MFNAHNEMKKFHSDYVRITRDRLDQLKDYRDKNIERLRAGLYSLGYSYYFDDRNQGSYAMHTMIQHRAGHDYDIDVAVVFTPDDLPSTPLKARQRVRDGVIEAGGNFKDEPEARTNAVTVWYADGYHVDLPVFREYIDEWGNAKIEHAGTVWTPRNPVAIAEWFEKAVKDKSPKADNGATVEKNQLRRIVRLLKMFAVSRDSWDLAGGLIITVLAEEQYRPDYTRDDCAFYNTMVAIHSRLLYSLDVCNPTEASLKLNDKDEHTNRIARLRDKLADAIEWLKPLFISDCDDEAAYKAWNMVFQHEYWQTLVEGAKLRKAVKSSGLYIAPSGIVTPEKPANRAYQSPEHRFYGEE